MWFEATSSLKVKLDKNEIIPIGGVANAEELASMLGCRIRKLPSTHLGLPFEASHKSSKMWDAMEERFGKKTSNEEEAITF